MLASLFFFIAADDLAFRREAVAVRAPPGFHADASPQTWRVGLDALAPVTDVDGILEEGHSDADWRVRTMAVYDARALYVFALVTDDHVVGEFHGDDLWRGDQVEWLAGCGEKWLHVGVSPNGESRIYAGVSEPIEAHAMLLPQGYSVQAVLPWAALGCRPGDTVHFNIAARDTDPGVSPPAHRAWSGYRHNLLASAGTLRLRERVPPSKQPDCAAPKQTSLVRPLTRVGRQLLAGATPTHLRLVNFQTAEANWAEMWTAFDAAAITRGLDRAVQLGFNSVRLFVFFEAFGDAHPSALMLGRLHTVVDFARARGLIAVISFFADKKDFRRERYAEMETHLQAITKSFAGDPAIAMWDLMNEPDHAWALTPATATQADVAAWAEHMAAVVRAADATHLLTIGLAGHFARHAAPWSEQELLPFVDVLSLHWYFPLSELAEGLAHARGALTAPIILQEIGTSDLVTTGQQAQHYFHDVCARAEAAEISGVGVWELYDHPVGSIKTRGPLAESAENYFGLLTASGEKKPQANALCHCLSATRFLIGAAP